MIDLALSNPKVVSLHGLFFRAYKLNIAYSPRKIRFSNPHHISPLLIFC